MKKSIFILLLIYSNCFFAAESKYFGRSLTPWERDENKITKFTHQSIKSKPVQAPVDSCPRYQVYTKKVITSSSRGEINNTGWILKDEFRSCDSVDMKEKRISYDVTYLRQGDPDEEMITTAGYEKKVCVTCTECVASQNIKELKVSFPAIKEITDKVVYIINKTPRVGKVKLSIEPEITVRRGEECCSKAKPPVTYTELKGGVEGKLEVEFNLWGLPDFDYTLKLWAVMIIAKAENKVFLTPFANVKLEGVGKFYGKLGEDQPNRDCKACFYLRLKAEFGAKVGIRLGGTIAICYRKLRGGYDVENPDEIELKSETTLTPSVNLLATYAGNDCVNPAPGLHGSSSLLGLKFNFKINVKVGPISFDINFERNLINEWSTTF